MLISNADVYHRVIKDQNHDNIHMTPFKRKDQEEDFASTFFSPVARRQRYCHQLSQLTGEQITGRKNKQQKKEEK